MNFYAEDDVDKSNMLGLFFLLISARAYPYVFFSLLLYLLLRAGSLRTCNGLGHWMDRLPDFEFNLDCRG
jgi:hypothetical protein